ncbi:ATPase, T2SS/T4P/T4SS family [Photobacterium leiognathi]|uniref:ATPase, T2SS/T4P/T4SS family n=1 Tax=Photobacterium leiognathi TaxID=553611 RepID=UPI002981CBC2|nr:ATPase, T2SS/T4P/T4SS family [Photobacterium leiognathi]
MQTFNTLNNIERQFGKNFITLTPNDLNATEDMKSAFFVYVTETDCVFLINESLTELALLFLIANIENYESKALEFANDKKSIDTQLLKSSIQLHKAKSDVVLNIIETASLQKKDNNIDSGNDDYELWDELLLYCHKYNVSDIHIMVERANTHIKVRVNRELRPYGGDQNFDKLKNLFRRVYSILGSEDGIIQGKSFDAKQKQDATLYRNIGELRLGVRWVSITKDGTEDNFAIKCRFLGDQKQKTTRIAFEKLGFILNQAQLILESIEAKGINLIIGETSSGKSVTLVNLLLWIYEKAKGTRSVYSFENPIERRIDGVEQYTLPTGGDKTEEELLKMVGDILSYFYRGDPETVAVGEMRDKLSVKAGEDLGNTGHNVHATLHCEYPIDVPQRLISLGGNPRLVYKTLNLCIAQSLLKGLCPHCCYGLDDINSPDTEFKMTSDIYAIIDKLIDMNLEKMLPNIRFRNAKGCEHCNPTGDKTPLYGLSFPQLVSEVMTYDKEILQHLTNDNPIEAEKYWLENKNITKTDVALYKANKGLIDLRTCLEAIGDIRKTYLIREKNGIPHFDPTVG